jgi:hypothetical protein
MTFASMLCLPDNEPEVLPATLPAAAAVGMPTSAWGEAAGPGTRIVRLHRWKLCICWVTGMHCPLACYASLLHVKQSPGPQLQMLPSHAKQMNAKKQLLQTQKLESGKVRPHNAQQAAFVACVERNKASNQLKRTLATSKRNHWPDLCGIDMLHSW